MPSVETNALVDTDWLAKHRTAPDIRIVDATCVAPAMKRTPLAEYRDVHIPGAVYFDIDDIADNIDGAARPVPWPRSCRLETAWRPSLHRAPAHRRQTRDPVGLASGLPCWSISWSFQGRAFAGGGPVDIVGNASNS